MKKSKLNATSNSAANAVKIVKSKGKSSLSNAQKLFNTLIKRIENERKLLISWKSVIPLYQQKYSSDYVPLSQKYDERRAELVQLFDTAYSDKTFSKTDKKKLSDIICSITSELLVDDSANENLKIIYNKYSGGDFDTEAGDANAGLKSMMEQMLGLEIDDDIDLNSPEEMMQHIAQKMQREMEQEEQLAEEHQNRQEKRKLSAKALAKEAKLKEEAQNISQSIREVFRKLASALHPDREQDAVERDRKTALMQRVNVAYQKQDLLALLELQLEVEQIDQASINTIAEDKLKYYNKVLDEQCAELRQELGSIEFSFRMRFDIPPHITLSPTEAMRSLQYDIVDAQQSIDSIKKDLASFQDVKNIKNWLKTYHIPNRDFYENEFLDDFDLIFGGR